MEDLIENIQSHFQTEFEKVPNKQLLFDWLENLLVLLFPLEKLSNMKLRSMLENNQKEFHQILLDINKSEEESYDLSQKFYLQVNKLFEHLQQDAEEFLMKDPAAQCKGEILHTYPGFYAIAIYRIAHILHTKLQLAFIPRMLTEFGHSRTGIDIHPGAIIDSPFFIDHGTGVVIGETAQIGKHVNVYQGVTLGSIQVEKELQGTKRHPTVEDNVVIYANATILGGNTIVGNHSVIGGNVFLTKSVDPYSMVFTKSEVVVKPIVSANEPINFII